MTAVGEIVRRTVVTAPAKLNLALHVVGRRPDGYHLLDSVVAFASLCEEGGDVLAIDFAPGAAGPPAFAVTGPFAADVPHGADNIVLRAAEAVGGIAAVHLEKNLPVAAGIGGGSADAAAVLRAAAEETGRPRGDYHDLALSLGADVPVCLHAAPVRMGGIGERLTPLAMPRIPCVLVNPGVALATPAVFAGLATRWNPPLPPQPADADGLASLAAWLRAARNDLGPPAEALAPVIGDVLAALTGTAGCTLARMSGSGATVFGLYADDAARDRAADLLGARHPEWWVRAATIAEG